MSKMGEEHVVLVGEGSSEPTSGFADAISMFTPSPVRFCFGVRRGTEGLEQLSQHPRVSITANFPGRGLANLGLPLRECSMSTFDVSRMIETGALRTDALLVVASPPDSSGYRSVGTVNGLMQAAVDKAAHIIVEEHPGLRVVRGAARIPPEKVDLVVDHEVPAYSALSRAPDETDYKCAQFIDTFLSDGISIQIGVGGIIGALGSILASRRNLKIVSGAVGDTIRNLQVQGCLAAGERIRGTALVGDDELLDWAIQADIELMPSGQIHNPDWLGDIPRFHAVNVGITVDLDGNVNSERIGTRTVSGKGGAPNFAEGASRSEDGISIVALRTDKGACLVDRIDEPTIPSRHIDVLVCEKGAIDLRGKCLEERRVAIRRLFDSPSQ